MRNSKKYAINQDRQKGTWHHSKTFSLAPPPPPRQLNSENEVCIGMNKNSAFIISDK
jgi:hypothetical protein